MTADALGQHTKAARFELIFTYEDENGPREEVYTDVTSSTFEGAQDKSEPSISIDLGEQTGGLEEREVKIEMPTDGFTLLLASDEPFHDTDVIIREYVDGVFAQAQQESVVLEHFRGKVATTTANFRGDPGRVEITCINAKAEQDRNINVVCDDLCAWRVGRGFCTAFVPSETLTVLSVEGTKVTTASAPVNTSGTDKVFHRGVAASGSLKITIRDWDPADPTVFYLVEAPPVRWNGDPIVFSWGCDNLVDTCQNRFNRLSDFMGVGVGITSHNELFEDDTIRG